MISKDLFVVGFRHCMNEYKTTQIVLTTVEQLHNILIDTIFHTQYGEPGTPELYIIGPRLMVGYPRSRLASPSPARQLGLGGPARFQANVGCKVL